VDLIRHSMVIMGIANSLVQQENGLTACLMHQHAFFAVLNVITEPSASILPITTLSLISRVYVARCDHFIRRGLNFAQSTEPVMVLIREYLTKCLQLYDCCLSSLLN